MKIRIVLYMLPFFIMGILFSVFHNMYIVCAALAALIFIAYKKRISIALFGGLFLIIGIVYTNSYIYFQNNKYQKLLSYNNFSGLIEEKCNNEYKIKNFSEGYNIYVYIKNKTNINPGDYIKLSGSLNKIPENKKVNYLSNGTSGYVKADESNIYTEKRLSIISIFIKIKYKIVNAMESISKAGGSFISGLVFGYTNDMGNSDMENFNVLGISHILAVSGFNIAIIYYFITRIMSKISAKKRFYTVLFSCTAYVLLSGFEASILRAYIMILINVIGKYRKKSNDSLNAIGITALFMLVINPILIVNMGFILTFCATAGIMLFGNIIALRIPKKFEKYKDDVGTSIAAFISTMPVILYFRGYISVITIFINILIAPLVSLLTIIGFISSIVYIIFSIKYILYPIVFLGEILLYVSRIISKVKLLIYPGCPNLAFIIIYYLYLFVLFGYIKFKVKKSQKTAVNFCTVVVLIILLIYRAPYLKIHFLNVGQGDSIFIETPDRKSVLVDTGPAFDDYIAAEQKVIPYIKRCGYNKIDYMIISHFHNDHAGGVNYILNNFKVKNVIAMENKLNVPIIQMQKGDVLKLKNVVFNILAPDGNENMNSSDENERCIVLSINYKSFNTILTADAEKSVMNDLGGNYDIYKVQHHGSIESYSREMVDNSNIGIAVISVGKNNYGHPSIDVINDLQSRNIKVYRTDINGNITVSTNGKGYKLFLNN